MDNSGYSSTMDAILFLSFVSIAALIISPVLIGNLQLLALIEKKSQVDASAILLTILNAKSDDFRYRFAGTQLTALDSSSLIKQTSTLIAGRENKHKTFADLSAECLASQFYIYQGNSKFRLNIFTQECDVEIKRLISSYLDEQLGDRYFYCFEAKWRPFIGLPVGGEIKIGERIPSLQSIYMEKTTITMPYENVITREWVEKEINEELEKIDGDLADYDAGRINKTVFKERVKKRLFNATALAVERIAERILKELLKMLKQNLTFTLSEFEELIFQGDELISNYQSSIEVNEVVKTIANASGSDLNEQLENYLKTSVKAFSPLIEQEMERALDKALDKAADKTVSQIDRALALKERLLDELFARLSLSKAEISLAIWDRRM
jgi:hypothetical protein